MSLNAVPFLFVNLGSEMMLVLEQRLRVQNIPPQKASVVLEDLLKHMFDTVALDRFAEKQALFSMDEFKMIFTRISQSSIMKLSAQSMTRLFELMVMGVKQQIMQCRCADDFLVMTIDHLNYLTTLNTVATPIIEVAMDRIQMYWSSLCHIEQFHVLSSVTNSMHHQKTKVTLFLQEGTQTQEGNIRIPTPSSVNGVEIDSRLAQHDSDGPDGFPYARGNLYLKNLTKDARLTPSGAVLPSGPPSKAMVTEPVSIDEATASKIPTEQRRNARKARKLQSITQAVTERELLGHLVSVADDTPILLDFLGADIDSEQTATEQEVARPKADVRAEHTTSHIMGAVAGFDLSDGEISDEDEGNLLDLL